MAFADENNSVNDLDRWIEKLNDCKPLTETEVKLLCELVSFIDTFLPYWNSFAISLLLCLRPKKFFLLRVMSNQ